ncbi:orotate phosphoribosyltransferase [Radiobacillus kanasensis]|uniref:orotate phosphoribosyltransferase n=1 Tax=Radiobacillus kanasensis TaxID=2844358 RepID=UPI001E2C7646|nr:orotate phosphoribosyltransferase [Radiobacillus kanasensis]UFU00971.1 orotate phosphoribosyltransferase [Radiobacillus kanasensis]
MSIKGKVARDLFDIGAIQIRPNDPFTWTSGIQSPIYCDNRMTMSYPEVRDRIADAFVEMIEQLDEKPDVIAGCATAGIPHAAWVAQKMGLPMIYVRSSPKKHGKGNQIEGSLKPGHKVLVIEDLISTGGSSIDAALAVQNEGGSIVGVFAIFTYGLEKAKHAFARENMMMQTITNYDQLMQELVKEGPLSKEEKDKMIVWRDDLGKISQ